MEWFRCTLRDDAEQYSIVVDVLVEDGKAASGLPYFGEFRNPLNDCYPIVFSEVNHAVDGGTGYEEARFERMKLHGNPVMPGSSFIYDFLDGETVEFKLVSMVNHAPKASSKGGRPIKDTEWAKFWLAIVEIAHRGQLHRQSFASQNDMIKELKDPGGYGIDMSEESLKPRVSQIWNRLKVHET